MSRSITRQQLAGGVIVALLVVAAGFSIGLAAGGARADPSQGSATVTPTPEPGVETNDSGRNDPGDLDTSADGSSPSDEASPSDDASPSDVASPSHDPGGGAHGDGSEVEGKDDDGQDDDGQVDDEGPNEDVESDGPDDDS